MDIETLFGNLKSLGIPGFAVVCAYKLLDKALDYARDRKNRQDENEGATNKQLQEQLKALQEKYQERVEKLAEAKAELTYVKLDNESKTKELGRLSVALAKEEGERRQVTTTLETFIKDILPLISDDEGMAFLKRRKEERSR